MYFSEIYTIFFLDSFFNFLYLFKIWEIFMPHPVFPAVTYESESWTVRKKIDAFELWKWRRILRVPWTEKRTNLSVLGK